MFSASKIDCSYDDDKNIRKIDFGVVSVGSVHKRSIDITNELKKTTTFKVKNNNELMYLADSISFEPSKTPQVLPNKNTTFSVIFSPKSVHVQTTLEYFTISSTDDQIKINNESNVNESEENKDETVQKIIVCVQGSCYGPTIKISPTKVFVYQSGADKQTIKCVNLINNSKIPGQYQVQYDWANCPLKCYPSFGVVKNRVQIKLELKSSQIGYYYKRLYILIANHHPVYVDVYAFSSMVTTVDSFSCFRTSFELPAKRENNNYVDFFNDVAHPSLVTKQLVTVFPKELHFGYTKNTKTMLFNVHNNSDSLLRLNWIHEFGGDENPFDISPKLFHIDSRETKTLECVFRPKAFSKFYFSELEAIVYYSSVDPRSNNCPTTMEISQCADVVSMNVSIIAEGHSFKKPLNVWKPKCKLSTRVIVMPPCVPASEPVFATFLIKKVVQVPTTFEFRPPDNSMFLVKPKCGLINSDYQIVVFQLLKTNRKEESIYAEQWSLVFDGFDNDSININIYASVEFGCVTIGEKNRVLVPNDVQIGCEINAFIPIVNMTRHRLHYYIKMYNQHPKSEITYDYSSLTPMYSEYCKELETEEMGGTDYECTTKQQEDVTTKIELEDAKSLVSNNSSIMSIESMQSLDMLKNNDAEKPSHQSKFVFKFDKDNGELGPNEKCCMKLSFCPLKNVLYTVNARCYLTYKDFPDIVNVLPLVIKGNGCNTTFEITPKICDFNDIIVYTEKTQQFNIKNRNCSYAKIKITTMPILSIICLPMPTCTINPETFEFTPEKNYCKMDLTIQPTALGFQQFFVNIQLESKEKSYLENENKITVCMNIITCALKISRISNDSIPYFGKLTMNKLFNYMKVNNELSKMYIKNIPSLTWTIPVISKSNIYEFQLYNLSKIPIIWRLKPNKCIKCIMEKEIDKNKGYGNISNKCVHYKSIQISPTVNFKMGNFSKMQVALNNINKNETKISYKWSVEINKTPIYNTELLIEPKELKNDLISFDPKYGINGHLEFNFIPIFIAHPNPPVQAFWVYNDKECNVNYLITDNSLTPAYPYFHCLNPSGIVYPKSVHPILFIFAPDKLCTFEAIVMLFSNNNKRQITLIGQGDSYTRTFISPGPGLSSFLPIQNDRMIFLSTECIILKPMSTNSNVKSMFCLYNNSDEDILYEWKKCAVEEILITSILPFKGNLKRHKSQIFEITVTSYNQPAILTIMFNLSYKLVSQNENYNNSLRDYKINNAKLDGVFIMNEYGNYKPTLVMKLENKPQVKHLVLNVSVRIIDEYNSKWIIEAKNNIKRFTSQDKKILKPKIQYLSDFQNILWTIVDKICTDEIECNPLYYYQLRNSNQKISKEIPETTKNNLKVILTSFIKDSLIDIYPTDMWKN